MPISFARRRHLQIYLTPFLIRRLGIVGGVVWRYQGKHAEGRYFVPPSSLLAWVARTHYSCVHIFSAQSSKVGREPHRPNMGDVFFITGACREMMLLSLEAGTAVVASLLCASSLVRSRRPTGEMSCHMATSMTRGTWIDRFPHGLRGAMVSACASCRRDLAALAGLAHLRPCYRVFYSHSLSGAAAGS